MVTIHSSKINERQLVKRYLFVLFFINCFCISSLAAEISDAQQAILDTLPADQRESILIKMRQAESLQTDLEETFDSNDFLVFNSGPINDVLIVEVNLFFTSPLFLDKP